MTENLYTPDCVRTFCGMYVNLKEPRVQDIFANDIAIGLARIPRFAGHTNRFYSVAEHSMWCMTECLLQYPGKEDLAFKVFLHDAHEYLLCDIPGPLKELLPGYNDIAQKLQNAIHARFGVRLTNSDEEVIKTIDRQALEWEWDKKVLRWTGFNLPERVVVDLFIHHFVKLCKEPHVLQPSTTTY